METFAPDPDAAGTISIDHDGDPGFVVMPGTEPVREEPKRDELDPAKEPTEQSRTPGGRKRKRYRSPQRRIVVGLIQVAFATYVTLVLVLIAMETRLVYPGAYLSEPSADSGWTASLVPSRPMSTGSTGNTSGSALPRTIGGGPIETVEYESTDSITLRGRLLERGPDRDVVLYFHGNGIKAAWMDGWIDRLSNLLDANVMVAEYRGYADQSKPTERGVLADCFAAREYLCDRYQIPADEIILYGESLGGGCAVAVASQGGAKALILDRTFDRMTDVAAEMYPYIPVRWIMNNRYDSIAKMTVYQNPLIMIHGTDDELIPFKHGRRLYDSARCDRKRFIKVDGLGHLDPLPNQVLREMKETLEQFTKEPLEAHSSSNSLDDLDRTTGPHPTN